MIEFKCLQQPPKESGLNFVKGRFYLGVIILENEAVIYDEDNEKQDFWDYRLLFKMV